MTTESKSDTARRRLVIAMLVAAVVATGAAMLGTGVRATFGGEAAGDEPHYLLTALSLWEDGDLDISDEVAQQRWRGFFDGDLSVETKVLSDGRELSPRDPLLPALLAAPMGLGGYLAAKSTLAVLSGAVAALLVWVAVRRFGVAVALAGTGSAVLFASPPLAIYGQLVLPEAVAAFLTLAATAALTGPLWRGGLTVLVLSVVALPWLDVKFVPVAAALALVGLLRLLRNGRHGPAAGLVTVLGVAGLAYLWGRQNLWEGWTFAGPGTPFQQTGEPAAIGVSPDYLERSLRLVGLLTDQTYGLVPWQPAWLLAVPALAALLWVRPRGWVAVGLPLVTGWAVATWLAVDVHGFWWPGRHVVIVLPLAALALLWWIGRIVPRFAPVALAVALVGVWHLGALLIDGRAGQISWAVGFEQVNDPIYAALRLLFPNYQTHDEGFWPAHLAWTLALVLLLVVGAWSTRLVRVAQQASADPPPPQKIDMH